MFLVPSDVATIGAVCAEACLGLECITPARFLLLATHKRPAIARLKMATSSGRPTGFLM